MIKRFLSSILGIWNLEVQTKRPDVKFYHNEEMYSGLERIKSLFPKINTIVDVGAALGSWSVMAMRLWPHARFVLFEPLEERRIQLEELKKSNPQIDLVYKAAGETKSNITFYVSDDLDGSGIKGKSNEDFATFRDIQVTTIDDEIRDLKSVGPFIVKLDTHGFEIPIIKGCTSSLNSVDVFIIECYGFNITEQSLLFWEMCEYLSKIGFRLFDLVDVLRRRDGAFWQCDAIFIRDDHEVFSSSKFSS